MEKRTTTIKRNESIVHDYKTMIEAEDPEAVFNRLAEKYFLEPSTVKGIVLSDLHTVALDEVC